MDAITQQNLQQLSPFIVMILTLGGLLIYARFQGIHPNQLASRDLDPSLLPKLAWPRVVGSAGIILLIVFKWLHNQVQLMTFVAMPLVLLALIWHTLIMIEVRQTEASQAKYKQKKRKS